MDSQNELGVQYSEIASEYHSLGQNADAREYYEKAIRYFPEDLALQYNLVQVYVDLSEWELAEEGLADLRDLDPSNLKFRELDAYLNYRRGDTVDAVSLYEGILSEDEVYEHALYNLVLIKMDEEDWEGSQFYLDRLLELDDSEGNMLLSAQIMEELDSFDSAIAIYEEILKKDGPSESAQRSLLALYLESERFEDALLLARQIAVGEKSKLSDRYKVFELELLELKDYDSALVTLYSELYRRDRDLSRLKEFIDGMNPLFSGEFYHLIEEAEAVKA